MEELEFKGTKGNTKVVELKKGLAKGVYLSGENQKYFIAEIITHDRSRKENLANANLYAAAQDLLVALHECMGELYLIHSQYGDKQNARDHSHALTISEKAIEKALK